MSSRGKNAQQPSSGLGPSSRRDITDSPTSGSSARGRSMPSGPPQSRDVFLAGPSKSSRSGTPSPARESSARARSQSAYRRKLFEASKTDDPDPTSGSRSTSSQSSTSQPFRTLDQLIDTMGELLAEVDIHTFADIDAVFAESDEPELTGIQWINLEPRLQLGVLAELPAAQLISYQMSGSPLKEVIDANEIEIAQRVIDRKQWQLVGTLNRFNYSHSPSLFDALFHWTRSKGLWSYGAVDGHNGEDAEDFIYHYVMCGSGQPGDAAQLRQYLKLLVNAHEHRLAEMNHAHAVELATRVQMPAWLKANQVGAPNDVERAWAGQLGKPKSVDYNSLDIRPLTSVCCRYYGSRDAALDETAFLDMFGLPPMPQSGPAGSYGARVAYCSDKWNIDSICDLLKEARRRGDEMPPLRKASILDSVFVW